MKKSTFLLVAGLFLFIGAYAQSPQRSCYVYEMQEAHFQQDPVARARYAQGQAMIEQYLRENPQARTQAIINVPVVVHVLLPAPQHAQVTDAIILGQIDTLNRYYGGAPVDSDSLRVYTPFRTAYGRSEIRFCMAQRTPANLATNGITRTVTDATFTGGASHPGSLIFWDPTKYLNIWVVNGANSGLLGYAYKPGAWAPGDSHQGFVNDYRAFGSGPGTSSGGYHFNNYNGGKTAVHEIGHYFNLDHPWGPNNSGNPTCTLSDQCADTPPTVEPFFGCPGTIPVLNACSPSAPGVMWQNHMDYADDRCMILFTNDQCARMMAAINTFPDRTGLLSSNGCLPPPVLTNDIRVSNIIYPTNNSTTVCNPIIPQVTVTNNGTNLVSSYRVNVILNNGAAVFVDFPTANIAAGASQNLTLTGLPQNLVLGANALKIYTSLPNGGVDAIPANDTSYSNVTRTNGSNLPVVEGFESATFPPTGWTLNTGNTWIRTTPGFNSSFSSWANFWDFSSGTTLTLTTPTYSVAGAAGAKISFDLAHWAYTTTVNDRLIVEVSNNCGSTFPSILYDKTSNTGLSTVPGTSGTEFIPNSNSQWRRETVAVPGAFVGVGTLNVRFRAISNFGNNVFIDNINIEKVFARDLTIQSITRPGTLECGSFAPVIVVENVGLEAVSAFSITYQLDGGATQTQAFTVAIAPGATATITLNNIPAQSVGPHTINICTASPVTVSGTGDQNTLNDCRTKTFSVTGTIAAPLVEGFEGTFPPAGWAVSNPDASLTWVKTAPGLGSTSSAYVNNFNYTANGRVDELYSPLITYTGVDSVTLSFDVAAATYTYPGTTGVPLDTLEVLVTKDCGNSFVSVWKKWGEELQTINDPNYPQTSEFVPTSPSHWRNERVDLTGLFSPNGPAQLVFRNTTNFENNIFVDNVNLSTRILPNTLKEQGYLILPNPFNDQFTVWHLLPPTNLRFVSVYNSAGQLVWKKQFNGDATKQVDVDLTGKPAGTYVVNIGYSDRVRDTQVKVVKLR